METDQATPLLIDAHEVARLTGLSWRSIERLRIRGILTGFKPAGVRAVRFRREDVVDWVRRGCPGGNSPRRGGKRR